MMTRTAANLFYGAHYDIKLHKGFLSCSVNYAIEAGATQQSQRTGKGLPQCPG